MAIQNFISGGYYGKMGETVGQRWKNKRTIRAYVIPRNPRTEAQQANRRNFALCTEYSQIALSMNFKAPCFQSESNTEWGLRMKTCLTLRKNDKKGAECIPVIPTDYTPLYSITSLSFKELKEDGTLTLIPTGNLPTVDRDLSVYFSTLNEEEEFVGIGIFKGKFVTGDIATIEIYDISDFDESLLSSFLMVSNDDKNFDNSTLYCPELNLISNSVFEGDVFSASELPDGDTYSFDGDTLKTTSKVAQFNDDTFKVL